MFIYKNYYVTNDFIQVKEMPEHNGRLENIYLIG
jgi:hypothetical protein